jgi:hypothetical protein
MKSYIIFPHTAWTDSVLGFAGIQDLADEMKKRNAKFKATREYQAIVFEIEKLDKATIELIRKKLPGNYEVPALLEGSCSIFSRNEVVRCSVEDEKFKKLMRDAHLQVTTERKVENTFKLSLTDINRICNSFADSERIPMAFKGFDIERLRKSIHVDKRFEHKLEGVLVNIKVIWFALDYDLAQLARNTGENPNARFKRYIYVNNAIVRIGVLWEKLIGLAILLERPHDFDKILSRRKVRSRFIKNFKDAQHPVVREIWDYLHSLETFENRFRTPELHKMGRTIWWAAQKKLGDEINRMLSFRNDLNRLLRNIQKRLLADAR